MGSDVKPNMQEFDAWIDSALRFHRPAGWLAAAPDDDVVLSSRVRLMRNLAGFPFPWRCSRAQLEEVQRRIRAAVPHLAERERVPEIERGVLLGSRLVSPDFPWNEPGRSVFLSEDRTLAVMANEEDHLRIQAIEPGLQPEIAEARVEEVEQSFQERIVFARHPEYGFLAASPSNVGSGKRVGVMLHLPATVLTGTLPSMGSGIEVRGLYGEVSVGAGAFVQVSTTCGGPWELRLALDGLILQERESRTAIGEAEIEAGLETARGRIDKENGLSLWEAANTVSWLRLGATKGKIGHSPRGLDALLSLLTLGPHDEPLTNLRRTRLMRRFLELTLPWAAS